MPPFTCSQLGCGQTFMQTSDHTRHIQNHNLSWLNIQPNIHAQPQSPSPPMSHWLSRTNSPLSQDEHQQPDIQPQSQSPPTLHLSLSSSPPPQDNHQQSPELQMPDLVDDDDDDDEGDVNLNSPNKPPPLILTALPIMVYLYPSLLNCDLLIAEHKMLHLDWAVSSIQQ